MNTKEPLAFFAIAIAFCLTACDVGVGNRCIIGLTKSGAVIEQEQSGVYVTAEEWQIGPYPCSEKEKFNRELAEYRKSQEKHENK